MIILGSRAKDLANKNECVWRATVRKATRSERRTLERWWQRDGKWKRSERSKESKTPEIFYRSMARLFLSLGISQSDGMFINRLISEIGGWFRVVAGRTPRLRLNIKVLFQSGPSARASAIHSPSVYATPVTRTFACTHAHVHTRTHTDIHLHFTFTYVLSHTCARTYSRDR